MVPVGFLAYLAQFPNDFEGFLAGSLKNYEIFIAFGPGSPPVPYGSQGFWAYPVQFLKNLAGFLDIEVAS